MGKKLVAIFCVTLSILCWMKTDSEASTDPYVQGLRDPVSFWIVDADGSGQVNLSVTSISLQGNDQLEYNISGVPGWSILPESGLSGDIDITDQAIVYLRLFDGNNKYDTSGNLTFSGFSNSISGLDLFSSLLISWGTGSSISLSWLTPQAGDKVAPVPIPASALLLGAGLLAIVGFRRRIARK